MQAMARGLLAAALVIATVTALLFPLSELDPGVSSGVLYVLGVLLLTFHWGLRVGLVTSIASAVALGAFHGDLHNGGDLVAISVLLLTATVGSFIADRARVRVKDAEERARLREVRASRARVLAAADDERRRVVRDLHDGAQQRLVHTVVTLKLARRELDVDPAATSRLIGDALEHAQRATTEIRELAHGILPAVLTRGGLTAGVEALVSRMPVDVDVGVSVPRLPSAIEATAYFVVAEALTNVAKHAHATSASVRLAIEGNVLRVAVQDDGAGGAVAQGNGLLGLDDRLAALDGTLIVRSPPGRGTLVEARIPVGS
jgi:signal transduction histidine kinase